MLCSIVLTKLLNTFFQTEPELRQAPDGDSTDLAGKVKFREAVRRVRIEAQVGAITVMSASVVTWRWPNLLMSCQVLFDHFQS